MCPVLQPRVMGTKLIVCFVFPVLHDQSLLCTAILNNSESEFGVADDANIFVFIELENIVDHLNFCHNPSRSPSPKSNSKVQIKSPSLSPSQESKSKL